MKFNILSTEINFSFSFLALILLFCVIDDSNIYLLSLCYSILHEATHLIFICVFGCKIKFIKINAFGCNIVRKDNNKTTNIREIIVHLSAPVFNLIIALIAVIIFKHNTSGIINLMIGMMNLIPFYDFDGGNALYYTAMIFTDESKTERLMLASSVVVIIVFTVLNLFLSFFVEFNYSVFVINIYIVSMFLYKIFKH